jgi:hypothetical protein
MQGRNVGKYLIFIYSCGCSLSYDDIVKLVDVFLSFGSILSV